MSVIIHCRWAHSDCLAIVKEVLPCTFPVHLHCVLDSWELLSEWADWNSNVFFGFTNVIGDLDREGILDVVRRVRWDRFLLETDAPHHVPMQVCSLYTLFSFLLYIHLLFVRFQCAGENSFPGHISLIASTVARARGVPFADVARQSVLNLKELYQGQTDFFICQR